MPHLDRELHGASDRQLLQLSRDALRRAHRPGHSPLRPVPGQVPVTELNETLGLLSQTVQALESNLAVVRDQIRADADADVLDAVEGVFTGEPVQATEAATLWLERARDQGIALRQAIENAHIAASGLAARH